jgi:hypothetical protein
MYLIVDGTTSTPTFHSILKGTNPKPAYAAITIFQRTTAQVSAATYNVTVYAYTIDPSTSITCIHLDMSVLGNLS